MQRKGKVNEDTSHVDIPLKDTDTQRSVAWITTKSLKEEKKASNFNQISKFIKVKKKKREDSRFKKT